MIRKEDASWEKTVLEEEYPIAVPMQIIEPAERAQETEYLVYSFCEQLAYTHQKKWGDDPFAPAGIAWLREALCPLMRDIGFSPESLVVRRHLEYRVGGGYTPRFSPALCIHSLEEAEKTRALLPLSDFSIDETVPEDLMAVIRVNDDGEETREPDGRIAAYAAVNDLQEDELLEITVACAENYRRRGYATRCVETLADALMQVGRQVKYLCLAENTPSIAVAEKAGFQKFSETVTFVCYRSMQEENQWEENYGI